jgi:hypothetical protein
MGNRSVIEERQDTHTTVSISSDSRLDMTLPNLEADQFSTVGIPQIDPLY